ncbi:unnamed protein product [Trifolium pratense]|uniref:Uncharacterized protein n=1 Tax=Trifolium pratense TaxID=57577 RepID=A0ACB0L335_TRIPR|nr:unnamed protein product [Trifolium pratense]
MEDIQKKRMDFSDYVKSRLARFSKQKLAIEEFKLSVNCFELGYMSRDVDLWLKLASESGVEVLELCNHRYNYGECRGDQCYVLPKSVIEAKSLTKLVLTGKIRVDQAFMNHSIKLFSLRELNLSDVHLEDEKALEHLISHCPLIEIITLMHFCGSIIKSLSMHGLQKLKTVEIGGIKEVYIDDAPNLKELFYLHENLHTPLKIDLVRCENLKELVVHSNNSTTIITNKWFLDLFPKFSFLERLELLDCTTSEKINISSVRLKFLKLLHCYNLKEANIDAPNLSSCNFLLNCPEPPIVRFLRISSQLEVLVEIIIHDFDGCYLREVLQNITPQNVLTSLTLSLYIYDPIVDAPMFLDILTPPPTIKHMNLLHIHDQMSENLFPDLADFLLLCCVPATISLSLNTTSGKSFTEACHCLTPCWMFL